MAAGSFTGWLPFHLSRHARMPDGTPALQWCWLGERRLDEPFFEQTVEETFRASPWSLLLRRTTSLDEWSAQPEASLGPPPSGFIFHVSRCGSTLISQSLAALADALIVSEPRPLASFLALTEEDENVRARRFRALIAAYGQRRRTGERRFFVKFDSVCSLDLAFVRRVFPQVPWIFVYREPVEVLVSNLDSAAAALTPGQLDPRRLGFDDPARAWALPPREYAATVLTRYYAAGLENIGEPGGLLLNYDELPGAISSKVARHFGRVLTAEEAGRMNAVTPYYAKESGQQVLFEADSAAKQRRATASVRALAERLLQPIYEQLESRRRATEHSPNPP